jgi:hypothetical protein
MREGGTHVSCSGKYSVYEVFQLNIKVIQDAVKTVCIDIIVSKIVFTHYFIKYFTSMNMDTTAFSLHPPCIRFC